MANNDFLLQFQEFDEDGTLSGNTKDSTSVDMDDMVKSQKQNKTTGPTPFGVENDELDTDDDKAELLSNGKSKNAPFWTFEYYQMFFDVDTQEVKERIFGSVLPWRGKNFVRLHIRSNPDLYGPFWICATLVFAIAISGNISTFLKHHGNPQYKYVPEFRKVTMAATAIYTYAWLVPLALWGFLTWRNSKVVNSVTYSFLEIVCVYGYSLSIYIPAVVQSELSRYQKVTLMTLQLFSSAMLWQSASLWGYFIAVENEHPVLWIIPNEGVRWFSIVAALCLSGSVLVMTFWPAIRDDHRRVAIAIIVTIVALHVLLAVGCKAYFFSTREYDNTSIMGQKEDIKTVATKTP